MLCPIAFRGGFVLVELCGIFQCGAPGRGRIAVAGLHYRVCGSGDSCDRTPGAALPLSLLSGGRNSWSRKKKAAGWMPAATAASMAALLCDYAAGDSVSGVPGGIGLVVIRFGVDDYGCAIRQ